jgi:hypothetical protein
MANGNTRNKQGDMMKLNTTEIMSIAISVMVVIIAIVAIVVSLDDPNYVTSNVVMWPF